MGVIKATRHQIVLKAEPRDAYGSHSFVFELAPILPLRSPRLLRIEYPTKHLVKRWEMPWAKFLRQHCVGDVAIIDRGAFKYSELDTGR